MDERTIFIIQSVAIEYNDSDYDVYPLSVVGSVHTDGASAEQARIAVAEDASKGWNPADISQGSIEDGETVFDAVLRCVALCETTVSEEDLASNEPLYALLAPAGVTTGDWGCGWKPSKCWGVCRSEQSVALAQEVLSTLRREAHAVMREGREETWLISQLSDLIRLHRITIPS